MRTLISAVFAVAVTTSFACGSVNGNTGGGAGGGSSTGGGTATGGGSAAGGGSATGGGTATGGGSATGGGAATGGGSATGGGGGGTPITITFSTSCPAFTPCGGAVLGAWSYTGVCVNSNDVFPSVEQACPGTTFSNLSGTQQGGVTFDATTVHRDVHLHLAGTMSIGGNCALAGCSAIQTQLQQQFASVTCTGSSTCSCDFVYDFTKLDNAPYTASGTRVTTDPGTASERQYDYCVAGSTLTYQEVTAMAAEPGVSTMQR